MSAHVSSQMVGTAEGLLAHTARERANTSVNATMSVELIGAREAFTTGFKLASIGLFGDRLVGAAGRGSAGQRERLGGARLREGLQQLQLLHRVSD